MVEPISMAVGTAIGVAGLYSTCLQAIDYQAVQNFESDSQWLVDLFEAERILLRGWGRRVGIENGGSQHPCLDASSEEYAIVKRLLEHIRQIWVDPDAISRKYDIKLMGDAVAGGSYGFISFTPRRVSLRRKIVWASRDKAKYKRLVENLSYLTHKLNDIASISDGVRQLQCGGEGYRDGVSRLRALVEGDRKRYFDHIGGVSVEAQYRGVGTRATDEELTEFLSSEGFQSWFNGIAGEAPSSLLWLQGDAGVGKTVLTATMIEHVKENSSYPTAFFFCHYGQHPWNKTEHVLRSWVAQLARQSANAFEIIQRHFPESPRGLAELDVLWRVLSEITKTLDSCHLVLDALDECDGGDTDDVRDNPFQGNIGRFLQDLLHHTRDRGTKIFISSRRVGYFEALSIDSDFSSTRISLYPFEGRSEQNTRAYIDAHLINRHYSESDRRRLVDAIEKRCGGDRSWVSMELGYISWVGTTESIDQLLRPKLPTTEGLSMRIVEKICNLDGRDRELARNILEVAISSDNHRCYHEPTICNVKDVQRMHMRSVFVDVSTCAAEALRLCGPAVKMATDGSPAGCVVFAHGFDKISLLKSALFGDISYQHAVVSNMALKWHLSPPETKHGGPNFFCSRGPDWLEMFQDTSGEARVECLNHQRNLLGLVDDFREFAQVEYVGRASNDAHCSCLLKEPVGELTPLTFACRHGLVEMFTELMANSSNIEPNLISVAAWNGRAEIVRILLSRGDIDPNTHSIEFAPLTPLGHAIAGRNLKVVEVLLDSQSVLANGGFRVEESPGDQVVCDACTRLPFPPGSVVDVFLSRLQLAIVRRYKGAIKLLLSRHKPAPRFRSVVEFHQIMLMSYATRRGYGILVSRILFGKYLDVNPLTKDGKTALDLAVSARDGGDLEIWEMLKERGAWSGDDLRVWMRWYSKALRITFVVCSLLLFFGVCKYAFWPGGIRGLGRVWDGWSRFVE